MIKDRLSYISSFNAKDTSAETGPKTLENVHCTVSNNAIKQLIMKIRAFTRFVQ